MKYKGFSLVELLTVLAIIALLAGILFPVFSSAREKARSANCQTNLMELGQAVTMYAQDFDGRLLPCISFANNVQNEPEDVKMTGYSFAGTDVNDCWAWSTILYPYVKNTKTFICPSGISEEGSTYQLGYAINVNITSGNKFIFKSGNVGGVRPKKINEINGGHDVYLISDGSLCGLFGTYINGYVSNDNVYIPGSFESIDLASNAGIVNNVDDAVDSRHNGYINMLFLDNHVSNILGQTVYDEISKGTSSVALNGRN